MKKEDLTKTVIELHHAIIGNGTKGLNEREKDLEAEVKLLRVNLVRYVSMAIGGTGVLVFIIDRFLK